MYRGIVATIPCGRGGLHRLSNTLDVPITDLVEAEGITAENRVWEKEPGAIRFDPNGIAAAPSIRSIFDWWPSSNVQRLITYTSNGKLYKEVAGDLDSVELATGLVTGFSRGVFVAGGKEAAAQNRKLFHFNRGNQVKVLSGDAATMASIASPPVDWDGTTSGSPVAGIQHAFRLWGWGNRNDPHRLYASTPENHEDYLGAGKLTFSVYPGVGETIIQCALWQKRLRIWKYPIGIFTLDDEPVATANWQILPFSDALGAAESPYAVLPIGNDVLFVTPDVSIHALSAVQEKDIEASNLSASLGIQEFLREQVSSQFLGSMTSVWYPAKQQAWFGFIQKGSTVNNLILKLDFSEVRRGGKVKVTYSLRDVPDALALRKEADLSFRPVLGDDKGHVWKLEQDLRLKDGQTYPAVFTTPETDYSWAVDDRIREQVRSREKHFDAVELVGAQAPIQMQVESLIDGGRSTFDRETVFCSMATGGQVVPIHGAGYRHALRVSSEAPANFQLEQIRVYFRLGGQRRR